MDTNENFQIVNSNDLFGFDSDEEILLIKCSSSLTLNSTEPLHISENEEIEEFLDLHSQDSDCSISSNGKEFKKFANNNEKINEKRRLPLIENGKNKRVKNQEIDCSGMISIKNDNDCKITTAMRQRNVDHLLKKALKLYPNQDRDSTIEAVKTRESLIAKKVTNPESYKKLMSIYAIKLQNETKSGHKQLIAEEPKVAFNAPNFRERLAKYVLQEDDLFRNGYPVYDPEKVNHVRFCSSQFHKKTTHNDDNSLICMRCRTTFEPETHYSADHIQDQCLYHPGKRFSRNKNIEPSYTCCNATDSSALGCSSCKFHVHEGNIRQTSGFVRTPQCNGDSCDCGIYALDCEMIYTTHGVELARVSLVDHNLQMVYDSFVKTKHRVIDYNTRFSGVTEEHMKDAKCYFKDAQNIILSLLCRNTIMIGHSMENDFISLKIVHDKVVDTSVMFPHGRGPPYKCALRNLSMTFLNKVIQNDATGHDSLVDASTCIELAKHKVNL